MGQFEVSNITHVDPTKVTLLACHNRLESSCQHYELDCALSLNIGKSNGLVRLQQQAIQVLWACRPCYPPIKVQTHSFVGEKVVLNHLLVGGPFPNILIALEWLSKHVSNCSAKALWWCSGRFVDFSSTTCAEEIPCDPKDVNTWKSFTRSSSCIVCAMDKSSLLCDWSVVKWTSAGLYIFATKAIIPMAHILYTNRTGNQKGAVWWQEQPNSFEPKNRHWIASNRTMKKGGHDGLFHHGSPDNYDDGAPKWSIDSHYVHPKYMRIDPCDLAVRLFMFAKLYAKRKLSQNFLLGGKFRKNFPHVPMGKLYHFKTLRADK